MDPRRERDACGIGFVADASGRPSRAVVASALRALARVRHRGAVAADARTGDGAGLLTPLPHPFLARAAREAGITVRPERLGVAMCFLDGRAGWDGEAAAARARRAVEEACREERLDVVAWRRVPVRPETLGTGARESMPRIEQALVAAASSFRLEDVERRAFRARRRAERTARAARLPLYVASWSFRTVTYKALCSADHLGLFYPDLEDPDFGAAFAVFHQRYSTNTAPAWERAQPFRLLCHNGEINTIEGNVRAMRAREGRLGGDLAPEELLRPVVDDEGSDSAILDEALDLLVRGGRDVRHALAMLVPPAWEGVPAYDENVQAFFRFHAGLMEPWDGPAALVFTDGVRVGAALDRNGLRPMRYAVRDDGLVACTSEAGAVEVDGAGVVRRGKLGPGEVLCVDPAADAVLSDVETKRALAARRPYREWIARRLGEGSTGDPEVEPPGDLVERQVAFGFTKEELTVVLRPMASTGHEPTSSMGDDTAIPPLAERVRPVTSFLRQRFAQVTNPPIDPLRERLVMSTRVRLGPRAPLLDESPGSASLLELPSFVLYPSGVERLRDRFRVEVLDVAALAREGRLDASKPSAAEAVERFRRALEDGVLKIMSKMGISTVESYRGAQLFEGLGLGDDVVDLCLAGTPSPLGGLTLADLGAAALRRHGDGYARGRPLQNPGFVKHRAGGDFHANGPDVVRALHVIGEERDGEALAAHALQRAVRGGGREAYRRFVEIVSSRPAAEPRDLVEPTAAGPAVPVDDVEPLEQIARRFSTGAMSHGALSAEAHEALALAMSMIGGKANTGEGGEDRARYRDARNSAIKQVASGRFGVTPEYCAFADELQIKIAQGSKPGEGGQLPGAKVTDEIARLRHTPPGVALISPPPHHDIYSIEDLAQLIFDLKQVNPRADVSVKLVATVGVGTIAAGVVKGLADVVHVAGGDGGTGASPLSSIKNAGLPWEVGLAETRRALAESGLRSRARIRIDGGLKTGRDVLVAALLGADEYSFGTAALMAEGCIMVRTCHRDTCPVGIASQRPELRARFAGTPEMVVAYLLHVAEDIRRLLASLGLRSMEEAVGRTDLLRPRRVGDPRADALEVEALLERRPAGRFEGPARLHRPRSALGDRLHRDAFPALADGRILELAYAIRNADRAVGARLGGAIARRFGASRPPGRVRARFDGHAGQSFGAFLTGGVELDLTGEANDYVGKGMAGGRIVVRPPADDAGDPVLLGNTVLYGATGGQLFCAGRAGERFAVRNAGAVAVVEGVGDHACEYMTGGAVVVLGPVGRNLGAGMSGGEAYVLDSDGLADDLVNLQLVELRRPSPGQLPSLRRLVERHVLATGSARGRSLLDGWQTASASFVRVVAKAEVALIEGALEGTAGAGA